LRDGGKHKGGDGKQMCTELKGGDTAKGQQAEGGQSEDESRLLVLKNSYT